MTTAAVDALLRVYLDPTEIGTDGYPYAWHGGTSGIGTERDPIRSYRAVKDLVRERDGGCLRCFHPYTKGNPLNSSRGEWSPCDKWCKHPGPLRIGGKEVQTPDPAELFLDQGTVEAQWRILTVHHLNGIKFDCRWFNLVSLCQRCHLTIQGKVYMDRPYRREHSTWFKPFAAAYYASTILGEELSRAQVDLRLDELLELQFTEPSLF